MACHGKAARQWIFHESSHLIVSDLFIFLSFFFQYSALARTPSVLVLTPRVSPHLFPLCTIPPRFHKWCSDVHQTQQWRITISCLSLSTKALQHFGPLHVFPCWACWRSLMWRTGWISKQTSGGPRREPLPVANANLLLRSRGSALFHRRALESTCKLFACGRGRVSQETKQNKKKIPSVTSQLSLRGRPRRFKVAPVFRRRRRKLEKNQFKLI